MACAPTKTKISLGICPVWLESSLFAWRKLRSLASHWAHSEDSDQTGQMPRLIWVFAGCTCHFVGFVLRLLKLSNRPMYRYVRKHTFGHVRPAKIQISLGICAFWPEQSLHAFWIVKDAKFLRADNKDSDQTARIHRLIWVFVVSTC